MVIIDTHTHIFPDTSAASILELTSKKFNVKVYGKGTAADLISRMDENGINYAVIHMVALNPRTVKEINTWLIKLKELKLQPEVQGFTVDNADLTYPLYKALADNGMTVMFHVGGNPTTHPQQRSQPGMILNVAKDFPELKVIAAHLGGLNMWTQAAELLAGRENVYMETSMTYEKISPKWAEKIIRKHGHHKIFFGTDYPFAPIKKCIESAMNVPFLNEREKEEVMGLNAMQFFKP
jgi:predicted TIM-barrel fold metal-dependent hydrolase